MQVIGSTYVTNELKLCITKLSVHLNQYPNMVSPILCMYQSLQVLQHLFVCTSLKCYPTGTLSLIYQTNSTFIVSTLIDLKFIEIGLTAFLYVPYKVIHSTKIFLKVCCFFPSVSFFIFITHFLWACHSVTPV